MENDMISRSALIAEIEREQSILHPCDRLEPDNIKHIIYAMPGVDCTHDLRAKIEADIATGAIPCTIGNRLLRYVMKDEV